MDAIGNLAHIIRSGAELPGGFSGCRAYPKSLHELNGALYFLARSGTERFLAAAGKELPPLEGKAVTVPGVNAVKCPLTPANARILTELFPFMAPVSNRGQAFSLGLGDRLGLASPGHIGAVRGREIFPVLAQQSMRELKLTGRTYEEVLAAAAFAVFQEDWRGGWGADGDHLKTAEEICYALGCGCSMITLDCSEQIGGSAPSSTFGGPAPASLLHYEEKYAGKRFDLGDGEISISHGALKEIVQTYSRAIEHAIRIYNEVIKPFGRQVDFEMSIDETTTPTTPEAHFVVASELIAGGVRVSSMAPRFCGEFQKGIDYIGNVTDFEHDFAVHERIARHFGYRLSIHSGSDKFAVFGVIGKYTGLRVHVKTAGTNWLEALRVAARKDPALFRELLAFALENLQEARAYYHISGQVSNVALQDCVPDEKLPDYLNQADARQILHITYGLMLQAKNADGTDRFKGRIYSLLHRYEQEYSDALKAHIGRHIDTLMGN